MLGVVKWHAAALALGLRLADMIVFQVPRLSDLACTEHLGSQGSF